MESDIDVVTERVDERSPLLDRAGRGQGNEIHNQDRSIVYSGELQPPVEADDHNEEEDEGEDESEASQKAADGMQAVRKRMKYIMPALAIGVFLSAADQTIVVSSSGAVSSELKALNLANWIATAYFLTLACFQPLFGKLNDLFGRKSCILFGYLVFGVGCILCGLAQTMPQLIAARAVAGLGGAAMTTSTVILLSDIVTLRERGLWQGYVNIIFATGSSSGAPLGGLLADTIGWRWAFLGQAPLCVVAFIAVLLVLRLPKRESTSLGAKIRRIDFLGAVVLIAALLTLLIGLDRGSNDRWTAALPVACLAVTLPLLILFFVVESKVAREPFVSPRVIFPRSMLASYGTNFFSMAAHLSLMFYIPLFWQANEQISASGAGLRLIPSIVCSTCGSLAGGKYMQKTGRFRNLTVLAYTMQLVGGIGVLLATGLVFHSTPATIVALSVAGLGAGIGITSSLISLLAHAPEKGDHSVATACSYLFRSLGSTVGISLSATALNGVLRARLTERLSSLGLDEADAADIAARVRESLAAIRRLPDPVRRVVVECYGDGSRAAFAVQLALIVGATLSAMFIREKGLDLR